MFCKRLNGKCQLLVPYLLWVSYAAYLMLISAVFVSTASGGTIYLSCSADNDLYQALKANGIACARFSNPQQAINNAGAGSGVMILADAYPQTPTPIAMATYSAAAQKNLKLYIEFPANLPGLNVGSVHSSHLERGVVTSDIFGAELSINDILVIHDCRYVEVEASNSYLVLAKVAGFDKAVFGLAGTATHPVLIRPTAVKRYAGGLDRTSMVKVRWRLL